MRMRVRGGIGSEADISCDEFGHILFWGRTELGVG